QFWPHDAEVSYATFASDGHRVLTASGNTAQLRDTGAAVGPPMVHGKSIMAIALSPDGLRVATAGDDKTVQIWEAATGKRLNRALDHAEMVERIAFDAKGDRLITATRKIVQKDGDATIEVHVQRWDIATGKPASPSIKIEASPASDIAFSSDGKWVATASLD